MFGVASLYTYTNESDGRCWPRWIKFPRLELGAALLLLLDDSTESIVTGTKEALKALNQFGSAFPHVFFYAVWFGIGK